MRLLLFAVTALALSSCSTLPEPAVEPVRLETVRIDPEGDLSLTAGGYVDVEGFAFDIWFENDATDLSTPKSVTWSIIFNNYCRDRDSWIQSVVLGPEGQVWRGYRTFVPAGPDHPQNWSSGGSGADEYGGPATPGLMEAIVRGGRFTLAAEDDTGQRWNAVVIDTLTPDARNRLFAAQAPSAPRQTEMLVMVDGKPPAATQAPRSCP
ncbi:hypothetical protein [Brevundimonas sp. M20]|uniref:hypothetical protein n=1 Tax=Brevundimonas sp. M20 TaxID=2591463 RepID=UPI00114662A4|nr:hypothetical protein [Brevundimonas sp. M20]QDH72047.1 hypothetical protein FKQ52_00595 [Brevundimonas sp. M20]